MYSVQLYWSFLCVMHCDVGTFFFQKPFFSRTNPAEWMDGHAIVTIVWLYTTMMSKVLFSLNFGESGKPRPEATNTDG